MKTFDAKTKVNGVTISTVYNRFERNYETLVTEDYSGDELKLLHAKYKHDAEQNHFLCVVHFSSNKNRIHIS